MKKSLVLLVRIAVVVAIFTLILKRVSLNEIPRLLTTGFYVALAGAVVLNLAQAAVCTIRWMSIAKEDLNVPGFLPSYAAYMEGLFFNQALPSFVGGDAVRVIRWRSFGVNTRVAILSVVQDRLFGAIGAALIAILACTLLADTPVDRTTLHIASLLSSSALLCGVGFLVLMQSKRLFAMVSRFPRIWTVLERLRTPRLHLKSWVWLSSNAVIGHMLSGISVYLLATSLGVAVPPLLLVSITGIVMVVTMIPISLAGWGVREASLLLLLIPLGVDRERALMLSVAFGLSCLLSALMGGVSIMLGLASSNPATADQLNE